MQADFLRRAGLPYEPLPRDDVNPAAHPEGSSAAAEAEALSRALATVAQSRGEVSGSAAISQGKMDFFLVRFERQSQLIEKSPTLTCLISPRPDLER